ncbi:MAG: DUF4197 domain-containing protein [Gammaproteobacteria bacterium]|nr:DUF4197 domain-containing protein [Gammaproteobacteria bacterium]
MKKLAWIFAWLTISLPLHAASLEDLSNKDVVSGLKEALTQSSSAAVGKLGQENGFFGNDKVKIPLPDNLRKVEGMMRTFGMGKQADELILAMNRAAEAAVPEAKTLLIDAAKKMTVQDAKGILTGGDDAATAYFRKNTETQLTQKFLPIVKQSTAKVGLAQSYNSLAGKAAKFGLANEKQATIENYVTAKALDGLYLMMAEEEKAIRANPLERTGTYIQKVFGILRK